MDRAAFVGSSGHQRLTDTHCTEEDNAALVKLIQVKNIYLINVPTAMPAHVNYSHRDSDEMNRPLLV